MNEQQKVFCAHFKGSKIDRCKFYSFLDDSSTTCSAEVGILDKVSVNSAAYDVTTNCTCVDVCSGRSDKNECWSPHCQNKNWVMMKDEFCAQKVHTQVGLLNKRTVVCCLVQGNYCG